MSSNYMKLQIQKIMIDKWCEGCRIQADPGQPYVMDWIQTNGQWFRTSYDSSICKSCKHWSKCGHNLKNSCSSFEAE